MTRDGDGKGLPKARAKASPRPAGAKVSGKSGAIALLRTAMIEKKFTQAALADAADCHEKTIQNLLAGKPVRDQTLFDVAMVLGLDYDALRAALAPEALAIPGAIPATDREIGAPLTSTAQDSPDSPARGVPALSHGSAIAPIYMGAYTRQGTDHLIGSYLTVRPAFSQPDTYVAFRTDVLWDDSWPSLLFEERQRPDATYAHRGRLYIPSSSPFMHFVSLTKGAMRMILVSQIDREGLLRGIITTLNKHKAHLVPVATPIVYLKQDAFADNAFGEIGSKHPLFALYAALVDATIDEGYARLVARPRPQN